MTSRRENAMRTNRATSSPPPAAQQWWTVSDVAHHFKVSTRTVRRWIAVEKLSASRFGRSVRVSRRDVIVFERDVDQGPSSGGS